MSSQVQFPRGDQWKDVRYVQHWKDDRRKNLEQKWGLDPRRWLVAQLEKKMRESAMLPREQVQFENETLCDRGERLEKENKRKAKKATGRSYAVPDVLAPDGENWIRSPVIKNITPEKDAKARRMYELGLEKKAQREACCGLIGGETHCRNGHTFYVHYECGNRYCPVCGPKQARRLFARQTDKLLFVATRLMLCGNECDECSQAITEKRAPHWPPAKGVRPKVVCAKLDFTLKNTGSMPGPEEMRELNAFIKKFCRAIEKRFHIRRRDYGLAYCDELGNNNSNAHAHGIYVGPWLPQEKKELSRLWQEITGGSFIISIKYARSFTEALYHAVKYPAKFAERSTPERLAELELVFHRVRRFHTLAAFYSPEVPEEEKPPRRKCPVCDELLSEPGRWQTMAALEARGLISFEDASRRKARFLGLGGLAPP